MWDKLGLVAIGFLAGSGITVFIQDPVKRWLFRYDKQAGWREDKERVAAFLREWDYPHALTTKQIAKGVFASETDGQYVYELLMELKEEGQIKTTASKLDSPSSTGWIYVTCSARLKP
ncbi:hypothetical protein [Desmospora profundinema]|uniref:Uncharacterized protein n=1 Tax=Desmospora profundinema TaxID=1571184 RepID=A0ABU1IK42_9BACL|nr:hypothetical protein [Desmospora profundinema]MDR6225152.1 hypothetical protein [Desmospora profundinema]